MPRLHHSQIEDALPEDHTCPDCMLDRMDCVCTLAYPEDLHFMPDYDQPAEEPEIVIEDDDHTATMQAAWEWERDRSPHPDDSSF